jgi:hypothetical protein
MRAELTRLLHKMQTADGLNLVALISMDGLLIDGVTSDEIDAQQVAAAACNGMLMAQALGGELSVGQPLQTILEYQQGLLMLAQLNEDLGLVMLGPKDANLGRLRLVARKYAQEIIQAADL